MNNSNCVFVLFVSVYGYMCSLYCVINLVLNLLSSINCHCNQFLQHHPLVVIHLRPELPEYYFGSYIDNILESKHAEKVPSSDLNVIDTVCVRSVPGVFSPRQSDKSVVFHSSAQLQDMCLNDLLLKGPDLIHSQYDMLRCRSEKVVLSCDIKLMFYNCLVSLGFRVYICFLWFYCTHRSYRFIQSMFVLYM